MKKEKSLKTQKSQASLIVTVLLILVGITAVIAVAAGVIPFIRESLAERDLIIDVYVNSEGTYYNSGVEVSNCPFIGGCYSAPQTYVRVSRGAGNAELVAIKFIFQRGTQTLMYINHNVPQEQEYKTYSFNLVSENKTDSVKIAPVVKILGKEKTLDASAEFKMTSYAIELPNSQLEACSQPIELSGDLPPAPNACTGKYT